MYYLNPSTYWIGGVLAATLPTVRVICSPQEATFFRSPPGETCGSYAGDFVRDALRHGYLTNPDAVSPLTGCGYCQYRDGVEYLASLNIRPGDKWRDFGIFLAFCVSNWALVYFFIYTVRVKGWTFGLSTIFRFLGRGVALLKAAFRKVVREREGRGG
jgi:ATP-binding cassette, subfamily G (WHITE), member 2, SNQ2